MTKRIRKFPKINILNKSYINKYELKLYKFTHPRQLFESSSKILPIIVYFPFLNKLLYKLSIQFITNKTELPKILKSSVGLLYEGNISDNAGFESRHLADLIAEGNRFLTFRFLKIENDGRVSFIVSELEVEDHIVLGSSYPVVDRYWADRVELVLDTSRKWVHMVFESSDGIKFEIGGNTVMGKWTSEPINGAKSIKRVHNGWDHEHCAICHVSINEKGEHISGYRDDSDKWVCNDCYESYVLPNSLDFMELENI